MPKPDRKLGPYVLISKIGRGAFGVVWLAEKRTPIATTCFAIKLAHDDEIDLTTFKREAEIWIKASGHPNVLPIIEADIYDGRAVIVSEYAPDGSLRTWLLTHNGKTPSIEAAAEMTLQILAGLEHLHRQRIIHRDIKPDNILLQHGVPRLADFGIARVVRTDKYSSGVVGTLAYMAPECFDGKRSQQTDVWSVGVLLYEMLIGRVPHSQSDTAALISAIITKDSPPLPEAIPRALRQVVERALARNPIKRYHSAGEMRQALRAVSTELGRKNPAQIRSPSPQQKTLAVDHQVIARRLATPPEARTTTIAGRMRKGPLFAILGVVAFAFALLIFFPGRVSSLLNSFPKTSKSADINQNSNAISHPASAHDWQIEINAGCLVSSIAFSPDGKLLAAGTWCGNGITVWDAQTGQVWRKMENSSTSYSVAFSPNGRVLAAGSGDAISLWDLQSGTLIKTLSNPDGGMLEIAFSPDGNKLAARICCDGVALFQTGSGKVEKIIRAGYDVESVAFSPDGKTLATGSVEYDAGGVSLWDVQTGVLRRNLRNRSHGGYIAFSPNGKLLASGSRDDIAVWDTGTGVLQTTLSYRGSDIHAIAFSPDGKKIAAGGGYWEVSMWDVQLGTLTQKFAGHKDWITALAFSPVGNLLASGSGDGTIKLWR